MVVVYKVIDWKFDFASFGRDLKEQRQRSRLTKVALGEMIGRSPSHIGQIERCTNARTVAVADVLAICNLFDMDPRKYLMLP